MKYSNKEIRAMLYESLVKPQKLSPEEEECGRREYQAQVRDCRYMCIDYESSKIKRLCGDLLMVSWDSSDEIVDLFIIKNGHLKRL